MSLGDLRKKMNDYVSTKAIEIRGGGAEAYVQLGTRYEEMGWAKEAVEAFVRATTVEPNHPAGFVKLGSVYWRKGDEKKAADMMQKAMDLGSQEPAVFSVLGQALEKKGDA